VSVFSSFLLLSALPLPCFNFSTCLLRFHLQVSCPYFPSGSPLMNCFNLPRQWFYALVLPFQLIPQCDFFLFRKRKFTKGFLLSRVFSPQAWGDPLVFIPPGTPLGHSLSPLSGVLPLVAPMAGIPFFR